MAKGDRFAPEWSTYHDHKTGIEVKQLTNYKGHSHHLYFTNPGWYDQGQKLLFGSDRNNATNMYSIDLRNGTIQQLTELEKNAAYHPNSLQNACVNPTKDETYFCCGQEVIALDLQTLQERIIYHVPDGFKWGMMNVTADGTYLCSVINEDLSYRLKLDLGHGYVGFQEYWEARPLSRVLRINIATGNVETVFEEQIWIGHINTSPTLPHVMTFCHEGPWHLVDHRIWGLDLNSGNAWKIREAAPGERIGHEYWFADGEFVGYQGYDAAGGSFYGCIRYDNTAMTEAPFSQASMHFHSNDLSLIVGDGSATTPYLFLWRFKDGAFAGPRTILQHRGSFHIQRVHVHPRMSPDGKQIIFTSDPTGYGNVFMIDVPDFDTLSA